MCGDCCFAMVPAGDSCPCSSHIPQLYPPCSSSTLFLFLILYLPDVFHPFPLYQIYESSSILLLFWAEPYSCVTSLLFTVCSAVSSISCWQQPVHLPVCVFPDILFINLSAERRVLQGLQYHCRDTAGKALRRFGKETLRDLFKCWPS